MLISENAEHVALTAIYLAGKTEEMKPGPGYPPSHRGIDVYKLFRHCKLSSASKVYAGEMSLLRTLSFQLLVFHPMRALRGWIDELKESDGDEEAYETLLSLGEDRIVWAYFTDALFTATPGSIAASCLLLAIEVMGESSPIGKSAFAAAFSKMKERVNPEIPFMMADVERLALAIAKGNVKTITDEAKLRVHNLHVKARKFRAALERKRKTPAPCFVAGLC